MRAALGFALALWAGAAMAQDRPVVAVVNYPLAWMADRLGGDAVEVLFPVPPGRDPAFWRPGLAEIGAIQQADLIALNGAGYAQWVTRASLPRARTVDTSRGFADAFIETGTVTHSHGADGEHSHTGTASHTWLDFAQMGQQAQALSQAMDVRLGLDTGAALDALTRDLTALDAQTRDATAALRGTTILASHPRYQYFARAYGLSVMSVEWEAGAMPSDAQWQEAAQAARDSSATVLLWEAPPPEGANARAAALGLTGVVLPPLANAPADGDFLSAMSAALDALALAARN